MIERFNVKFVFIMLVLFMCSCDKEDEPKHPGTLSDNQVEYYVKYEFKFGSYLNLAKQAKVTVVTENGLNSFTLRPSSDWWEGTFGPFKKYTTVRLKATVDMPYPNLHLDGRVSISNGGPFILKDQKQLRSTVLDIQYSVKESDIIDN